MFVHNMTVDTICSDPSKTKLSISAAPKRCNTKQKPMSKKFWVCCFWSFCTEDSKIFHFVLLRSRALFGTWNTKNSLIQLKICVKNQTRSMCATCCLGNYLANPFELLLGLSNHLKTGCPRFRHTSIAASLMGSNNLAVRGKSHWKSSRWFLPFFVSYRSIAVGCELSLCPEMRTYKNDVRHYCVGFVALWSSWDVLDSQSRRLQWSALSSRNVWLQGHYLLVLSPSSLFCSLDGPKVC